MRHVHHNLVLGACHFDLSRIRTPAKVQVIEQPDSRTKVLHPHSLQVAQKSLSVITHFVALIEWSLFLTIATNKIPYSGLLLGVFFDGYWDAIHTRLLIRFGKPDRSKLRGAEARQLLVQQPSLSGFVISDIDIQGDTAIVYGHWDDKAAENDVRSTFLRIAEIKRVELRRIA